MRIFVFDKYTGLCLCLLCALLFVMPVLWHPTEAAPTEVAVCSVSTGENIFSVTFNLDGTGDDIPALLSELKESQCTATFFATEAWTIAHPASIDQIFQAGHTVASLIDTPKEFLEKDIAASINQAENAIANHTGLVSGLSRATDAQTNKHFAAVCQSTGRLPIGWSLDSLDWRGFSPEQIAFRLTDQIKQGSILRFQTGTPATPHFSEILTALQSIGYTPVPLQTLLLSDNTNIISQ